jgi:hypothetical protein
LAAKPKLPTQTLPCGSSVIPKPTPLSPPPEYGEPCAERPVGVNLKISLLPHTGASRFAL